MQAELASCAEHAETFMDLFMSGPHWLFELFLMALFDGLLGAIAWPLLKRWWARNHRHEGVCCAPRARPITYRRRVLWRGPA